MEIAQNAFVLVSCGIKDCLWGIFLLHNFVIQDKETSSSRQQQIAQRLAKDSPKGSVSNILLQCAKFGLMFGIFNYVYNEYILNFIIVRFVAYMEEDLNSVVWLQTYLYYFFCCFWIFPLLFLSKFLNYSWYNDIADLTFQKSGIKKNTSVLCGAFYADQIKSFILQLLYCVQGYMLYLLPTNIMPIIISDLWYLFHLSLLSALYAFEYKWVYMGWPLHKRLVTIDRKWPYFLGFGLPLAIVTTYFFSFINSMIVFATLFPIYVICSTVVFDSQSPTFSRSLPNFRIVNYIAEAVIQFGMKMLLSFKTFLR